MFKCQIGDHISKSNEKCVKVVLKTRPREYAKDDDYKSPTFNPHGPTFGSEIVLEVRSCALHAIGK